MAMKPQNRRGEHRRKLDYEEVERMLGAGSTQREVAEAFGVTQAAVANAVMRHRVDMERRRPAERAIPAAWSPVRPEHRQDYNYRMLRAAHRKRQGFPIGAFFEERLPSFLRAREADGMVVDYTPETGFQLVPRREGIDLWLVREPGHTTTPQPTAGG